MLSDKSVSELPPKRRIGIKSIFQKMKSNNNISREAY